MIILDTNVLSEVMRPEPEKKVLQWMDGMNGNDLGITSITVAEILYGIGLLPEGKKKSACLKLLATCLKKILRTGSFNSIK